jgi:hypothetical protein
MRNAKQTAARTRIKLAKNPKSLCDPNGVVRRVQ